MPPDTTPRMTAWLRWDTLPERYASLIVAKHTTTSKKMRNDRSIFLAEIASKSCGAGIKSSKNLIAMSIAEIKVSSATSTRWPPTPGSTAACAAYAPMIPTRNKAMSLYRKFGVPKLKVGTRLLLRNTIGGAVLADSISCIACCALDGALRLSNPKSSVLLCCIGNLSRSTTQAVSLPKCLMMRFRPQGAIHPFTSTTRRICSSASATPSACTLRAIP